MTVHSPVSLVGFFLKARGLLHKLECSVTAATMWAMFFGCVQKSQDTRFAAALILVASLIGTSDSFYLMLEYLQVLLHPGAPTPCTVNSLVSCTKTVQGAWGHFVPGVPNPMLGMLWYSGILSYGLTRLLGSHFSKSARLAVGIVLILGIIFSYRLYLASILELAGVCPFCLTSTTASTLIVLAYAVDETTYVDSLITWKSQWVLYVFQIFSIATFVIGLPLFLLQGLSWVAQPMEVILHWSFPVMIWLVVTMAVCHMWAFMRLRISLNQQSRISSRPSR